jgi:hypothetical protein
MQTEGILHGQVSDYIKMQYPKTKFNSDSAGIFTASWRLRKSLKRTRSENGLPDLDIRAMRGGYGGLMIELKAEGELVFKKDGTIRKNEHLEEQAKVIEELVEEGYYACFAVGFDEAKKIIDWYMHLPKIHRPCEK